ncbi:hypothetical protein BZA05DRAFT_15624 [Tricharina praecox]|uniref:uncharacterized protein n=1 Tax=Tricharina praecox TaxID=43433 RepID=UPI00221F802E|nr:uncharacterized protein BZA05DRAFT_15624 [Tricharina praecox]KAI5858839.1 hypothetical protein BZA05DRAFT_15624 [Tricharina praecox]
MSDPPSNAWIGLDCNEERKKRLAGPAICDRPGQGNSKHTHVPPAHLESLELEPPPHWIGWPLEVAAPGRRYPWTAGSGSAGGRRGLCDAGRLHNGHRARRLVLWCCWTCAWGFIRGSVFFLSLFSTLFLLTVVFVPFCLDCTTWRVYGAGVLFLPPFSCFCFYFLLFSLGVYFLIFWIRAFVGELIQCDMTGGGFQRGIIEVEWGRDWIGVFLISLDLRMSTEVLLLPPVVSFSCWFWCLFYRWTRMVLLALSLCSLCSF